VANGTEPKLVIYFNSNRVPLAHAAERALTHLNFAFLVPNAANPLVLEISGNITAAMLAAIPILQAAGKKVMISFGGGTATPSQYQAMVGNETALAASIADIVRQYGFDGVDIDYEDSNALMHGTPYDGVAFATALTKALFAALQALGGVPKLITHAPQPPYMAGPRDGVGWNAYTRIWNDCLGQIDWLNMQYYNNSGFNDPDQAIAHYRLLTTGWNAVGEVPALIGLTPAQLVMGKPVARRDAGSGYLPPDQIARAIVAPLLAQPGIGGVMGWQYASDPDGAWSTAMASALGMAAAPEV
jgi:chitinase